MARNLAVLFRPIVVRNYYDFDFSTAYKEEDQDRIAFCARCVPTSVLTDRVPLADKGGLLVPVAEDQLRQIHKQIVRRRRAAIQGRPMTFTTPSRIWAEDTRINLDFTVPFELCEFTLTVMEYFSDELTKLRRERLRKSNKMVIR